MWTARHLSIIQVFVPSIQRSSGAFKLPKCPNILLSLTAETRIGTYSFTALRDSMKDKVCNEIPKFQVMRRLFDKKLKRV